MTGPTTKNILLTFVPMATGLLSVLGASAILYNLLFDHQRRFTSPYFRIMFGLSLADLSFGLINLTTTFLLSKNDPTQYFAVGNQASCEAVGFLKHFFAFIQPLYVASLSLYYMLVIKYDMSDEYFKKKIELWQHIVSVGWPLLGTIVSESLGMFNVTPIGCNITAYPLKCDDRDKTTCTRGANAAIYRWIFSNILILVSLFVIASCMLAIVLYVRKRERIMNRRFSFNNAEISRSRNLVKQYKAVTRQAFLYIGSFLIVWIFPFITAIWQLNVLGVLSVIFMPLQGFFNAIIYFMPRYLKTKEEHRDKSTFWILKDMIFTTTLAKEQRRVVRHAVRRRSSLMIQGSPTSSPSSLHASYPIPPSSESIQNHPVVTFSLGSSTVNPGLDVSQLAIDNESEVTAGSPPTQISSIDYEPLVRFRETRAEMNQTLRIKEDENESPTESTKAAALIVQELYENDDDSTTSKLSV